MRRFAPYLLVLAVVSTALSLQEPPAAEPADQAPPAKIAVGNREYTVTTGAAPGYVADEACALCHRAIADSYEHVSMSSSFYRWRPETAIENFDLGPYHHQRSGMHYEMQRREKQLFLKRYRVSEQGERYAEHEQQVDWVIGSGSRSRGYLYATPSGELFQLPLVWYTQNGGYWGMAPGYDTDYHEDFSRGIAYNCMFCHNAYPQAPAGSDAPGHQPYFPTDMPEGIGCQRCHGPGAEHARLATDLDATLAQITGSIVNPSKLEPQARDDVCFQCHMQPNSRVGALPRVFGKNVYSFTPGESLADYLVYLDFEDGRPHGERFEVNHHGYRLMQSRCATESGELTCVTCHDPHVHVPEEERAAHYRKACLSCHKLDACQLEGMQSGAMDVDSADCAGCHMPERRAEDAIQVVVTDHRIRRHPAPKEWTAPPDGELPVTITDSNVYWPERGPAREDAFLYMTSELTRQGVPGAMEGLGKRLTSQPSEAVEPYLALATGLLARGAFDQAIQVLAEVIERAPELARAHYNTGFAHLQMGRHGLAKEPLEKARTLDPNLVEAHFALGRVHGAAGDTAAARAAFEEAVRLRPHHARAHFELARLDGKARRMDAAAKSLRTAIACDTRLGKAYLTLGRIHIQRNEHPECVRILEQGLEASSSETEALAFELGRLRLLSSDAKVRNAAESRKQAQRAVEADPKSGRAWVLLGVAQYQEKQYAEALASSERAEAEGGDLASALWIRALAHNALGKGDQARELHTQAEQVAAGSRDTNLRKVLRQVATRLLGR